MERKHLAKFEKAVLSTPWLLKCRHLFPHVAQILCMKESNLVLSMSFCYWKWRCSCALAGELRKWADSVSGNCCWVLPISFLLCGSCCHFALFPIITDCSGSTQCWCELCRGNSCLTGPHKIIPQVFHFSFSSCPFYKLENFAPAPRWGTPSHSCWGVTCGFPSTLRLRLYRVFCCSWALFFNLGLNQGACTC